MTETLTPVLPQDVEALVETVLREACDRRLLLATAESCTGGLVASVLTDVEGVSHAFDRGFVTYTDEAKIDVLGVSADIIADHGVVSAEVALAMARGAVAMSQANLAVAVTGFAGPAGPGDEPGLVHVAVCDRQGRSWHEENHFGDCGRGPVRVATLRTCLRMLLTAMTTQD